jgi:hypothetical protein
VVFCGVCGVFLFWCLFDFLVFCLLCCWLGFLVG